MGPRSLLWYNNYDLHKKADLTQVSTQSYHCWPFFEYSEVVFRSFGNFDEDIFGIIFLRKLALYKLKEQEQCVKTCLTIDIPFGLALGN